MKKLIFFSRLLLLAYVFCLPGFLWGADFTLESQVDKTELHFGETLKLILTISQPFSGYGGASIGAPQISEIPGFDIVGQRTAQNMTVVNGVGTIQIQTVLELVPKGPGEAVIPSLSIKGPDGKLSSTKAIKIRIHPPAKTSDKDSEPSASSAEPDEEGPKQGVGFFKGMMVFFLAIGLVIAAPIFLSWVMNRDTKPTTRWLDEEEAEKGRKVPVPPMASRQSAPVVTAAPPPVKFHFEQEVNSLKRQYPDTGTEFYRAYFDLLHRAVLSQSSRMDASMTPDELFKSLSHHLPQPIHQALKNIGNDWELIIFAHAKPSRNFSSIHDEALAILESIRSQETRP